MAYSYDRRASQGIVIREMYTSEFSGKQRDSLAPTCDDFYREKRSGHFYRGIEEAEWEYIRSHGHIKSIHKWCAPGEGTCFGTDIATAESYVDAGSTDPRKTGKPNYVIEVASDALKHDPRDGYYKTLGDDVEVPKSAITRAWKLVGEDGKVIAYPMHV